MQFTNLVLNLFTRAGNHGSQVTGTFGVNPPSASEHLDSANKKLPVPLPSDEN